MKKGFTLVEIILSIALITVIGVGSIIGFITYKNYSKEKALNEMDNEILTALRLYMETNEEIKSKVYEDKEGLAVSLQTLQNEGLIDFGNLDITDEDDYVVAFLTAENDCSDISTLKGWDFQDGKPLYICTNSSGNTNLSIINPNALNNQNKAAYNDTYYFRGVDANNWIKINNKYSRIISVDASDSITLGLSIYYQYPCNADQVMSTNQLLDLFGASSSIVNDIKGITFKERTSLSCSVQKNYDNTISSKTDPSSLTNTKVSLALCEDLINTTLPALEADTFVSFMENKRVDAKGYVSYTINSAKTSISPIIFHTGNSCLYYDYSSSGTYQLKTQLKSCIKIKDGIGTYENPYTIENKCS